MRKDWRGSTECDFCGRGIKETLYDAKTKLGPWATLCAYCYTGLGVGLGTGKGQKYIEDNEGHFVALHGGRECSSVG